MSLLRTEDAADEPGTNKYLGFITENLIIKQQFNFYKTVVVKVFILRTIFLICRKQSISRLL